MVVICPHCRSSLADDAARCEACGHEVVSGPPADAAVAPRATESRRLRILELALVVGSAFLVSTLYALQDWWTGAPDARDETDTWFSAVRYVVSAALAISLLAYVLHRQGRRLRSLGLTARVSDLGWALLIFFFARLLVVALFPLLRSLTPPPPEAVALGIPAFVIGLCAAVKEELIVRAFLMTEVAALTRSMAVAVAASVAFQTLYHLYQGTAGALVGAAGFFVFAVFYASTRRITPVILAHALHNFWIVALQGR